MSKILLESKITSNNEKKCSKINAILKENVIIYDEDKTKVKIELFEDELHLRRENEDYLFEFIFKEKNPHKTKYFLKKYNTYIDVKIITKRFEKYDKKYIISYELFMSDESNGIFEYELEWR